MKTIPESEGRSAFGINAVGYDNSRPEYPEWFFDTLVQQQVLYPGAVTLEIGPGNGLATRKIVELGASPVTLVEPDNRFAPLLRSITDHDGEPCQIIHQPFEEAELPASSFDLVVVATAFHWLDPITRVEKLAWLTKTGGAVVLLWNVFQDINLADPFHEATKSMFEQLPKSPSENSAGLPFALDRCTREAEFISTGDFELLLHAEGHWKLKLDPRGVRSLYEGYSNISRLPITEREDLLNRIEVVAKSEFAGQIERNMTSPLYVFRRV